ncbi:hypothetical protein ACIPYS_17695 [Kitasatospora sp. NPDC089913]|uniref:hypothetical protein n=1 Tax=Kitasatospora sp. NPDC089913 TaxID=3364080 RepID=UPI003822A0F2
MSDWTDTREGFARLGDEYTPDYRGYVINVRDEGEDWYIYAWDDRNGVTSYLARAATENAARELLELYAGIKQSGFLCDIYVSEAVGHCPESAVFVEWTHSKRDSGKQVHILQCARHSFLHDPTWTRTPIPEYRDEWGIDVEDTGIIGGRRGPLRDGEPTWVVLVDNTCQAPFIRATLRRALAASESVWAGTDHVNAAVHLSHNLPDEGPWTLTRTELHTIATAVKRRSKWGRGVWCPGTGEDEHHAVIAQRITEASEHAIRRRQQGLS